MMLPPALIVAFAVLLGYPLIQIAAICARRPMRLRFNALLTDLLGEPAHQGEAEQRALKSLAKASRGQSLAIALGPVMIPVVLAAIILGWRRFGPQSGESASRALAIAFSHFAEVPEASPLWNDTRLDRALDLAVPLELAAWPIATSIGAVLSIPVVIVATLVAWTHRRSVEILSLRDVANRLARTVQTLVSA